MKQKARPYQLHSRFEMTRPTQSKLPKAHQKLATNMIDWPANTAFYQTAKCAHFLTSLDFKEISAKKINLTDSSAFFGVLGGELFHDKIFSLKFEMIAKSRVFMKIPSQRNHGMRSRGRECDLVKTWCRWKRWTTNQMKALDWRFEKPGGIDLGLHIYILYLE